MTHLIGLRLGYTMPQTPRENEQSYGRGSKIRPRTLDIVSNINSQGLKVRALVIVFQGWTSAYRSEN